MATASIDRSAALARPQFSDDAEQSVLSAVLLDPSALSAARSLIRPEDFYREQHRRIFSAMLRLADAGAPIDPLSLAEELRRRGELGAAGGKEYIGDLTDGVPTAANIEYHARIVVDRAQRRGLLTVADGLRTLATDEQLDVREIVRAQRDAFDVLLGEVARDTLPAAVCASDAPEPKPIRWAIDQLWPAGELGLIVGDGGSFKSSASIHMAGAVAGGHLVFGRFATRCAQVLLVSAEDALDTILMRLRAFCTGERWSPETMSRVHIIADPDASLADPSWQAHIAREAARIRPGLIVFDPLAELIGGDESSNSEMRPFVKYMRRLGRETGAGIAIVHHAGKAGPDKRTLDRIRGASAFASAARTVLFFDFEPDGVRVQHVKSSRAPKLEPFVLRPWITSEPGNRANWISARLALDTETRPSRGEVFVLAQVTASPRQLGTGELKAAAKGTGIRAEDISTALASLQAAGRIDFHPGPRGARLWFPTLPNRAGRVSSETLPTLPNDCPGSVDAPGCDPAPPFRAGRQGHAAADSVGRVDEEERE